MNISASYRSHLFQIKSGGVAAFGLLMIYLCGGMGMDFAHQQVHAKAAISRCIIMMKAEGAIINHTFLKVMSAKCANCFYIPNI